MKNVVQLVAPQNLPLLVHAEYEFDNDCLVIDPIRIYPIMPDEQVGPEIECMDDTFYDIIADAIHTIVYNHD